MYVLCPPLLPLIKGEYRLPAPFEGLSGENLKEFMEDLS
jgi:hypothetical protein